MEDWRYQCTLLLRARSQPSWYQATEDLSCNSTSSQHLQFLLLALRCMMPLNRGQQSQWYWGYQQEECCPSKEHSLVRFAPGVTYFWERSNISSDLTVWWIQHLISNLLLHGQWRHLSAWPTAALLALDTALLMARTSQAASLHQWHFGQVRKSSVSFSICFWVSTTFMHQRVQKNANWAQPSAGVNQRAQYKSLQSNTTCLSGNLNYQGGISLAEMKGIYH